MRVAEEEANQATAAALVAETKVKQAEMRSQAVEDGSAQTAAKNAELLEQLQQTRGELVGAEERARLSDERFRAASERVEVVEEQLKELKVRLTVAKSDLPIGAVADKERSAIKDGLATQVRRPLTSILGVSLALQHNDPESGDGRELVRQLGANARKLDRMVGVLLEIDRLADGTLRLNRRRTDLQALVRRVVEDSPDLANRSVHVEAEKVVVPVDPFMVEEMVDTLLNNANGRTSSGSPVWISVSSDPEGAVIAVDDTGADVPEERRIAPTSSSDEQMDGAGRGGTSTGLAVLQRLAEVHAGRAWVEEREGGGASFRVFLPDVTAGATQTAGQAADRTEAGENVEETHASEE
jgi:K+-sensing histidine kinase KdpD